MAMTFDEICIDAADIHAPGWPHEPTEDGDVALPAPAGAGSDWLFVAVPDGKVVKNRIHFDFRRGTSTSAGASRTGWCLQTREATSSGILAATD
jgi:hypothetical protein